MGRGTGRGREKRMPMGKKATEKTDEAGTHYHVPSMPKFFLYLLDGKHEPKVTGNINSRASVILTRLVSGLHTIDTFQ